MARRRDVVVVGAGAMGSSAAWWLAREGADVVVLERFAAGHERGSSHGASRIFRLAYEAPLYATYARDAMALWRMLEEESGESLLTRTGGIDHGDQEPLDRIARVLSAVSTPGEFLSPADASDRWPGCRFEGPVLYQPDTGVIHADATVAALYRSATTRGAEFRYETPARAIRPGRDEVVVETDDEEISADVAIVTAGAWVSRLVDGIVDLPPLKITQEQPAYFAPRDPNLPWPVLIHRFSTGATGAGSLGRLSAYGVPTPGVGIKIGEHGTGPEIDPDRPQDPDPASVDRLARYVERWLPGLDPAPLSVMSCLYTTTPGEHFVVGRAGRLVIGSPCSGHGFKFTPIIGRLLSELARGRGDAPLEWATLRTALT